jgi:hypothetical protein
LDRANAYQRVQLLGEKVRGGVFKEGAQHRLEGSTGCPADRIGKCVFVGFQETGGIGRIGAGQDGKPVIRDLPLMFG